MIPNEAIEAARRELAKGAYQMSGDELPYADAARRATAAAAPFLRAQALLDAADELVWKRPEKSPCESFEACCGSEASCDAMQRSSYAVGEHWLRARAVTERGQG